MHTHSLSVLAGPSQAGPLWFPKVSTISPAVNAHKFWKYASPRHPASQFRDIAFLSEPGREALSCYFLPQIRHHIGEQHLTPMKNRVDTSLLWEHAARCFSSLTAALIRKMVCLSARHWVITHTYKIFLSTCGQRFPTPHLQMHV